MAIALASRLLLDAAVLESLSSPTKVALIFVPLMIKSPSFSVFMSPELLTVKVSAEIALDSLEDTSNKNGLPAVLAVSNKLLESGPFEAITVAVRSAFILVTRPSLMASNFPPDAGSPVPPAAVVTV